MIKFKVKDQNWKAFVLDHEEYEARFREEMGRDTDALTDLVNRQIFIDENELTLENVTHEMGHVYISFLHLETANLDSNQMEEIMVELWANEGQKMLKDSRSLFNKLKKENS